MNLATSFATTNNKTVLLNLTSGSPVRSTMNLGQEHWSESARILSTAQALMRSSSRPKCQTSTLFRPGKSRQTPLNCYQARRIRNSLRNSRRRYDYIIVDTPPYGLVSDSLILMKYVDIKLYVDTAWENQKKHSHSQHRRYFIQGYS